MPYPRCMPSTFSLVQRITFFGLIIATSALFIWLLRDLVLPLFWAVVFAILLYPLFTRITHWLGGYSAIAALLTIALLLIVLFVPLYFLGIAISNQAIDFYLSLAEHNFSPQQMLADVPYLSETLTGFLGDSQSLAGHARELVQSTSAWVATQAFSIGSTTLSFVLKLALALYVLFFLLKDGKRLGTYLLRIIPLGDDKERMLYERFASTTRAIIKGTVIVAIVQGAVGGALFAIAGIPSPMLWGVAMALAALIPALGAGIIWAPAGIILLLLGNLPGALIVLGGGALIVGLIDNILRPVLVGRDTEMPDALILLAILGGIASFGLAGIIIGPVIAALFLSVWDLFTREFTPEIDSRS